MRNKNLYKVLCVSFIIFSISSCKKNECYNIRNWEVNTIKGDKFNYTDTLELSKEPLKWNLLDTLLRDSAAEYIQVDKYRFSIESSDLLVWKNDTIKVVRVLKDGNLTFFYCKPFGVLMTFSRLKRTELKKIENTCTKQTLLMQDFINIVLNDTILRPLYERKVLK